MERTDQPTPQPSPTARQLLAQAAADWKAAQQNRTAAAGAARDQLALTRAHGNEAAGTR